MCIYNYVIYNKWLAVRMETILSWDQGCDLLIGDLIGNTMFNLSEIKNLLFSRVKFIESEITTWPQALATQVSHSPSDWTSTPPSWSQCEMSKKATGHPLAQYFSIFFRKCQESLSPWFCLWIIYYLSSLHNLPRLGGLRWGSDTCPGRGERVRMKDEMFFCCVSLCGTVFLSLFKL